jgi:GNAT superfamily N-acetyltransferase
MEIRKVTPEDAETIDGIVTMVNAADRVDAPWSHPVTTSEYVAMMRHGYDGETPDVYVGFVGDRAIGALEIWTSEWDNTHLAWTWLAVHPDARRRGHGSDLFEFAVKQVRGLGRRSIGIDGWDSASTVGFAEKHGLARKSIAVNRRQTIAKIDQDILASLYDEAAAAASSYELIRIAGRTPDDMLEAVAEMTASINDAPTDDLDIEDEVFPVERIVDFENATAGRRRRMYHVIARHRATGDLAGHTVVHVEEDRPHIGHQEDTSVVAAHRGHRLGILVKADMLRWLAEAEPQLETVDTWNAESNDHMIEVNEKLGYEILGRSFEYQADI